MAITQRFKLSLIPNSSPVVIHVNQYDTGEGRFVIDLEGVDHQAYTPASGATALIEGTKPDKRGYSYNATISGSTVTADLKQQMTVVAGKSRVNLIIYEGNDRTGTFVFFLDVQATGLADDTDTSTSELAPYIDGAQSAAREAAASAETASGAATTATNAKNDAVDAKNAAVSAKNDAVSAKNSAEAAASIAEQATLNPPYIGNNGNWYVWDTNTSAYVDSGIDASITVDVDPNTVTLPAGSNASVENTGTSTDPVFKFFIPQGATGKGITSITKTGTSGLVDTYTITYSDNTTSTFTVTNGAGSVSSVNDIQPVGGNVTLNMEDINIGTNTWNEIVSILS